MAANIGFAGLSYRWFIGQVPPNQNEHSKGATSPEAWGSRVKVRIPGMHDICEVSDDDLPWAIVAKPTSHGNFNGGTLGIYAGEWVLGFFLDETNQVPIITHILGRNGVKSGIKESVNGCTSFKTVNRYTSGVEAGPHQTKAGNKPNSFVGSEISKNAFNLAKSGISFI